VTRGACGFLESLLGNADEPSVVEKLALTEIRPAALRRATDDDLRAVWLRLHQWFANARKRKAAVEDVVNAAVWAADEMDRRGFGRGEGGELAEEIERLRGLRKSGDTPRRLTEAPREIVIVPDFVSVVGSAAKGAPNPADLDVLFRASRDGDSFRVGAEGVWLQLRNALDPTKRGDLHFIDNPQGPHGDYVPLYDLVLRLKDAIEARVVKEAQLRVDLGCGSAKPEGWYGIDKQPGPGVDCECDLERGIPLPSDSVSELRAHHVLEHLASTDAIMREIHRVLAPSGTADIEVPSTAGEGAFAHPDHKSFWNRSSFTFWSDPKLLEGRPRFDIVSIEDSSDGPRANVRVVLRKPVTIDKELRPGQAFTPPKPAMAGYTEGFSTAELWAWAKDRVPIAIEPKHNGFRAIFEADSSGRRLWFEGSRDRDRMKSIPGLDALSAIDGPVVLDLDVGIERNGKRVPRPDLQRLTGDRPKLEPDERVVLTAFDLPFDGEDLTGKPFLERRKRLEAFIARNKGIGLSPLRWVRSQDDLDRAAFWAFRFDRSEGLMAKGATGAYETRSGATDEWAKLKRVVEIKAIVLGRKRTATGAWNYRGGLLLSEGDGWSNVREIGGKRYVDLGESFNTAVDADDGDVITAEVLEITPDEEAKTLTWLGARVQDRDETRHEPYTSQQAIDIARRGGVLQKQAPGEEGGTRSSAAASQWRERWQEAFPSSGHGRFTYHHHWRGLGEVETKLGEKDLLNTDHSLHGDLRFEGDEALWGFSVFLGTTEANRKAGGDRLAVLPQDDNLQGAFKLPQPKAWLDVGASEPLIVEPGGVGATSERWSKFFLEDRGTYRVGVWREHMMEIFLDGDKLKGRFLLEFAPIGGGRVWIIDRPKDQTPMAESRKLEDVLAELRKKRQRWLVWAKPGERPTLYDAASGMPAKRAMVRVAKADSKLHVVVGVVLDPYQIDADRDWAPPAEVEKTAHDWLSGSRVIGFRHSRRVDGAVPVESWLVPYPTVEDRQAAIDGQPHRIYRMPLGKDTQVHSGAWVLGIRLPDPEWAMYQRGELDAYSVGGTGMRTPIAESFDPMTLVKAIVEVVA